MFVYKLDLNASNKHRFRDGAFNQMATTVRIKTKATTTSFSRQKTNQKRYERANEFFLTFHAQRSIVEYIFIGNIKTCIFLIVYT